MHTHDGHARWPDDGVACAGEGGGEKETAYLRVRGEKKARGWTGQAGGGEGSEERRTKVRLPWELSSVVRARAQIRPVLMANASVGWRNDLVSTPVRALLTKNAGDRAGAWLGAEGDVGRTTRIGED